MTRSLYFKKWRPLPCHVCCVVWCLGNLAIFSSPLTTHTHTHKLRFRLAFFDRPLKVSHLFLVCFDSARPGEFSARLRSSPLQLLLLWLLHCAGVLPVTTMMMTMVTTPKTMEQSTYSCERGHICVNNSYTRERRLLYWERNFRLQDIIPKYHPQQQQQQWHWKSTGTWCNFGQELDSSWPMNSGGYYKVTRIQ